MSQRTNRLIRRHSIASLKVTWWSLCTMSIHLWVVQCQRRHTSSIGGSGHIGATALATFFFYPRARGMHNHNGVLSEQPGQKNDILWSSQTIPAFVCATTVLMYRSGCLQVNAPLRLPSRRALPPLTRLYDLVYHPRRLQFAPSEFSPYHERAELCP
ncbi:hypothetical protein NPIL_114541 [Nephila pilipes]|uniref:Uncharacterized protein n=1 Tax=Nephila pilipes TaxID=299642 RepID=A0A8X6UK46_NEPPI|nr:hypothetical protein NPIL_114541 [Nephila pilipes]